MNKKDYKRFKKFQEEGMFHHSEEKALYYIEDSLEISDLWAERNEKKLRCADYYGEAYFNEALLHLKTQKIVKVKKTRTNGVIAMVRVSLTFKGMWYGYILEEYEIIQ